MNLKFTKVIDLKSDVSKVTIMENNEIQDNHDKHVRPDDIITRSLDLSLVGNLNFDVSVIPSIR